MSFDRLNLEIPNQLVHHMVGQKGVELLLNHLEAAKKLSDGSSKLLVTLQHRDTISKHKLPYLGKLELNGQIYRSKNTTNGHVIVVEQPNTGEIRTENLSPEGGTYTHAELPADHQSVHVNTFIAADHGIFISSQYEDYGLPGEILVEYILVK
ncbi:MAG: hypothetical protein DI585_05025 [Pseudomonas fluorescens]|nr:MAG: hypothetical protein DI585_05025 [Pseudomonas fluorescens]